MAEPRFYLDTSALLPYYRAEPASEAVEDFLQAVMVTCDRELHRAATKTGVESRLLG
ncbi:MAG: hypothetical protein Kow00129_10460 [Thermoleophilia bacterium]